MQFARFLFAHRPEDGVTLVGPLPESASIAPANLPWVIGEIEAGTVEDKIILCFPVNKVFVAKWVLGDFFCVNRNIGNTLYRVHG